MPRERRRAGTPLSGDLRFSPRGNNRGAELPEEDEGIGYTRRGRFEAARCILWGTTGGGGGGKNDGKERRERPGSIPVDTSFK